MKSRRRRSLPHVASCSGTAPAAAATTPPQYRAWPRIPGPHKQKAPPAKTQMAWEWVGMAEPNGAPHPASPLPLYPRATYTDKHKGRYRAEGPITPTPHHTTTTSPLSSVSLSLSLLCPCRLQQPAVLVWYSCSSPSLRPSPAALPLESGSQSSGGGGKSVASSTARNNPPANAGDRLVPSLV